MLIIATVQSKRLRACFGTSVKRAHGSQKSDMQLIKICARFTGRRGRRGVMGSEAVSEAGRPTFSDLRLYNAIQNPLMVHDWNLGHPSTSPTPVNLLSPRSIVSVTFDQSRTFTMTQMKRSTRTSLNHYFVLGKGIHREVMSREITRFLGPDATSKPMTYEVGCLIILDAVHATDTRTGSRRLSYQGCTAFHCGWSY